MGGVGVGGVGGSKAGWAGLRGWGGQGKFRVGFEVDICVGVGV